jgi:flagellar basal-body rod modification protein FlgD
MVNEVTNKGSVLDVLRTKENKEGTVDKTKKREDVTQKEDFLNILVTQLKNQDPLNPMENDQFAVDLAQFSQLEQLINLNEKFDGNQGGDAASLAQYLGQEVAIKSNEVNLGATGADRIEVVLPAESELTLDVLDANKELISSVPLGMFESGRQSIDLSDKTNLSGKYSYKVRAESGGGEAIEAESYVLGQVNGFVPGPDGKLIVGDREVATEDVVLVRSK